MRALVDVLGWSGAALVLSAFALLTARKLRIEQPAGAVMNLIGGALLMANTAYYKAWPSTMVNLIWLIIGAYGLAKSYSKPGVHHPIG